jgi:phosphate transport system substrate-binding protein
MKKGRTMSVFTVLTAVCILGLSPKLSAEEVTIVGSGSGTEIIRAIGEAFSLNNPKIIVNVPESIGSTGGIRAVGRDEYHIGRVARKIKENEQPYGLTYVPVAKLPYVFFVHQDVGVQQLSVQQVLDIYSGKTTNWQEVGGSDAKIRVVRRKEDSASHKALLKTVPGFKEITLPTRAKTTFGVPETLEVVETTKGTIGYGPYGGANSADVIILQIGDSSVADQDYPYAGEAGLIYKEQAVPAYVKHFIEFATSEAAHEAIQSVGGIPMASK